MQSSPNHRVRHCNHNRSLCYCTKRCNSQLRPNYHKLLQLCSINHLSSLHCSSGACKLAYVTALSPFLVRRLCTTFILQQDSNNTQQLLFNYICNYYRRHFCIIIIFIMIITVVLMIMVCLYLGSNCFLSCNSVISVLCHSPLSASFR
jgi:hypothetical protein